MRDDPQQVMARLETQLVFLSLALRATTNDALKARPKSGKWSAHENLAHLVQHHAATLERIRRILKEETPSLPSYRAEQDPEWPAMTAANTEEVLQQLSLARDQMIHLARELTPEQWSRQGVHPAYGPLTVAEWLDFFLIHEAHHLYVVMNRAHGRE